MSERDSGGQVSEAALRFAHEARVHAVAFHMAPRPAVDPEARKELIEKLAQELGLDKLTDQEKEEIRASFQRTSEELGFDLPEDPFEDAPLTHDQAVEIYGVEIVDEAEQMLSSRQADHPDA